MDAFLHCFFKVVTSLCFELAKLMAISLGAVAWHVNLLCIFIDGCKKLPVLFIPFVARCIRHCTASS